MAQDDTIRAIGILWRRWVDLMEAHGWTLTERPVGTPQGAAPIVPLTFVRDLAPGRQHQYLPESGYVGIWETGVLTCCYHVGNWHWLAQGMLQGGGADVV